MLSPANFFAGDFQYKLCANDCPRKGHRWSYESRGFLYDVQEYAGDPGGPVWVYRINGRATPRHAIHSAIVKHFNLRPL
jgi:hypothetical protein